MLIQTVQLTISILHVVKYKIYTRNNNIIYFLTELLMCDYALTCVIKGKTKNILSFKSFFPLIMKNKSISNTSAYVILSFVEILNAFKVGQE